MTFQKISILLLLFFLGKMAAAQSSPFDSVNVVLQKRVYFDFGKHDITPESVSVLLGIKDSCIGKESLKMHIEAHTDHIGTNENNLALSRKRSATVKDFFIQNQFPAEDITTSVFGESRPVADNTSDDGRQENRRAAISIYTKKQMTMVQGKVVDKKTGEGMQAKVIFHTKTHKDSMDTNPDGTFEKAVVENTVIGVDIYKEGYFFDTQMMKAKPNNTVVMSIPLLPIEVGEKVTIKNLYFVGNQAVLLKKSIPELPKVLKFMQLNPKIKIEIAGHINAPGRTLTQLKLWEKDLSTDRAKTVYDFLLENNIAEDRLTFKGYANTQMLFPEVGSSEKLQAQNRRVEIRILETGKVLSAVK